jgi:mRNA interferase HigB
MAEITPSMRRNWAVSMLLVALPVAQKLARLTVCGKRIVAASAPRPRFPPQTRAIASRAATLFAEVGAEVQWFPARDQELQRRDQIGVRRQLPNFVGLAIVPLWDYYSEMRVIALRTIKHFVDSRPKYSDAREPALAWYRQVLRADWTSPAGLKRDIGSASILKDGRVVFNIGGNKYRIVVWINYPYRIVYVRFIGTHSEYVRIDAQTVL